MVPPWCVKAVPVAQSAAVATAAAAGLQGGDAEEQRLRAELRSELEALREELFAVTEAINASTRR